MTETTQVVQLTRGPQVTRVRRDPEKTTVVATPIGVPGPPGPPGDVSTSQLNDAVSNRLKKDEPDTLEATITGESEVVSGAVVGAAFRAMGGIVVEQSYTQTVPPTDPLIGSPFLYRWYATLDDFADPLGARAYTEYGSLPRAAFELEGRIKYSKSGSHYRLSPLGFQLILTVGNDPGKDVMIGGSWGFVSGYIWTADNGTVTDRGTDVGPHGAAFIDNNIYATVNGGHWDGLTHDIECISYISAPWVTGNTHLAGRVAYDVMDVSTGPTSVIDEFMPEFSDGQGDSDEPELQRQVGLRIRELSAADVNIGIENHSTTVDILQEVTLSAAGDNIEVNKSAIILTNTSGDSLTLTSTPTILAGQDGQRVTILNGSDDRVILQDDATLTNTKLYLSGDRSVLRKGDSITLIYSDAVGGWCQEGQKSFSHTFQGGTLELRSGIDAGGPPQLLLRRGTSTVIFAADTIFGAPFIRVGTGGFLNVADKVLEIIEGQLRLPTDPLNDNDATRRSWVRQGELASTRTSAANLTLSTGGVYTHTGTGATWTLPTIASSANRVYRIKHAGTGTLTVQRSTGATENRIFTDSEVVSFDLAVGESATLINDGTNWIRI